MGVSQAQIELTAEPHLIDLSRAGHELEAALDAKLRHLPHGSEIILLIPASLIRTRRFALSMELSRPVAYADLDELNEAAADLPGEEEGLAVLYRQPAAFIYDHAISHLPPIGEAAAKLTTEFLDLSMPLRQASELEEIVTRHGHELRDIITPHEAIAYRRTTEDESEEALLIHLNREDMLAVAATETGFSGAGSMAAGVRHLETDLVLAGLVSEDEAGPLMRAALCRPHTAEKAVLRVLDARLEEMAGFAHHVRSAAQGRASWPVELTGLGHKAKRAAEIFTRVLDHEVTLIADEHLRPLGQGAQEAWQAPRRISLPGGLLPGSGNALLRWVRRHV